MVAALALLGAVFGAGVSTRLSPVGLEDHNTASVEANALVERATGNESVPGFVALLKLDGSASTPSQRARIQHIERVMRANPDVGLVRSVFSAGPGYQSRDGSLTYVAAQFRTGSDRDHQSAARALARKLEGLPGVRLGGQDLATWQITKTIEEDTRSAELVAFPILFLLSLWFFRGLVAAALPLVLGGSAIVLTQVGLRLATSVLSVSALALSLVTALGIGLAIDYSLLIVSRFREELAHTTDVPEALRRTLLTAGRTVMFSATTVIAALASLLVFPQQYFYSMGLGGALVALLVCLAALTVLPALLALLGPRINSFSPTWLQRSAQNVAKPVSDGRWYRFAKLVMRRPVLVAAGAAAVLIALGIPVLGMRFTSTNASILPTLTSARQVSNALARDFPTDPSRLVEAVTVDAGSSNIASYEHSLARLPGVASIAPTQNLGGGIAAIDLISTGPGSSGQAQELVRRVRASPAPFETKVTGPTAGFIDLKQSVSHHLFLAVGLVVFTTLLSIFLLTGSVVLPLKTLLMNGLTVAASLGALVLVFQDGWLQGLLGYPAPGAVDIGQPVLLIAVVFGLSTDYGVFLIDRIRESHDSGLSNEQSVALGLERTGRITTAAALLFCVAIGSLVTSRITGAREVSLGTAVAVLLDATVVRALLVPALMRLLDERNWWSPAPLRRIHSRLCGIHEPHPEILAEAVVTLASGNVTTGER